MADRFEISTTLAATPNEVYSAWLDSEEHSAFIGAQADVDRRVGGGFTAWGDYIKGKDARTRGRQAHRPVLANRRTSRRTPSAVTSSGQGDAWKGDPPFEYHST